MAIHAPSIELNCAGAGQDYQDTTSSEKLLAPACPARPSILEGVGGGGVGPGRGRRGLSPFPFFLPPPAFFLFLFYVFCQRILRRVGSY